MTMAFESPPSMARFRMTRTMLNLQSLKIIDESSNEQRQTSASIYLGMHVELLSISNCAYAINVVAVFVAGNARGCFSAMDNI